MMRFLMGGPYGPDDVTAATGGYATKILQRNWIARGLIRTPVPEAKAGKPRRYPWLAMIEAALLADAARSGNSLTTTATAMTRRLAQAARAAKAAGCEDITDIEALSPYLPEFQATPDGTRYGWIISFHRAPFAEEARFSAERRISVDLVGWGAEFPAHLFTSTDAVWKGITETILKVDALLTQADQSR